MTSKEIIKQIIIKLEDDLQHYTMVDIDRVKAKYIELEIKDYKQVLQDLERLETLEKNSDKVIKDSVKLINKNLELQQENEKLKKAIEIALKYDVSLESIKRLSYVDYVELCIMFNEKYPTQQEYELLKEVLGNET